MATIKQKDFQSQMNRMDIQGAYFLYGEEDYFVDEAYDVLKARCLDGSIEEFNYDSFSYPSLDFTKLEDSLNTLPMMAKKRLVSLQLGKEPNKADANKLIVILKNIPESSVLLIKGSGVEYKKAFPKMIESVSSSVRFYSPFPNEMARWVNRLAKQVGLMIDPDAAVLMFELIGSKLSDLKAAIEKLSTYLKDKDRNVTREQVESFFVRSKEDSSFDLANAVGQRNAYLALEHLQGLANQGINEAALIAILFRHFKNLYLVKEKELAGEDNYKIAKSIGVPPIFLKSYSEQTKLWSEARLQMAIQALNITEKALRSSKIKPQIWMENFILKLC